MKTTNYISFKKQWDEMAEQGKLPDAEMKYSFQDMMSAYRAGSDTTGLLCLIPIAFLFVVILLILLSK